MEEKKSVKTCCFSGCRPEGFPWENDENDKNCIALKSKIADLVGKLIEDGYTRFICGMARGTDTYCAEEVLRRKLDFPEIVLEAAIPFPEQTHGWDRESVVRYNRILSCADKKTVVMPHYAAYCMAKRNEYMVKNSDLLVAVWNGSTSGGTYNTIKLACASGAYIRLIRI